MAFRLRQIVISAGGRAIARERTLAAGTLTVGRAADNALQIADLAVEPQHAVIEPASAGRLAVRALGAPGFTLDGRAVREATIDPATPAELRFGSTTVTLSRDGDVVLIEVRAADPAGEGADLVADKARFSLARVMVSSRGIGWGLFAAILAWFLIVPVASHWLHAGALPVNADIRHAGAVIGDKSWNPGPLSLAHQALTGRCEACHVKAFQSVRNQTCMACHKDTHDHAAPARLAMARATPGAGGRMFAAIGHAFGREPAGACTDCHVEHQGARTMEPPRQAFCAACHAGLDTRVAGTALGNAADFGTQHPQFRAWVVTDADRKTVAPVSLDAAPHQDTGLVFSHKVHLDRANGVAKMALTLGQYGKPLECASCHQRSADGVSFQPVNMERDCEGCHSLVYAKQGTTLLRLRHGDIPQMIADLSRAGTGVDPIVTGRARPGDFGPGALYGARFTPAGGPAARAFARDGICGECHKAEWRDGKLAVRHVTLSTRYMPDGWFDHTAHRQTACADCHAAAKSDAASDVILPKLAECRTCHLGEAAIKPKVPSTCAMCHSYHQTPFAPARDRRRSADALIALDDRPGGAPR